MPLLKFCLNISFLCAFLLAPAILVLAVWYRKAFNNVLMMWRSPESVFATIAYFIQSLIWLIVGVSFFFNYISERPSSHFSAEKNGDIAMLCLSLLMATSILFLAARTLFVQVVTHKGIMLNHFLLRIPHINNLITWNNLADYYIQNDYPNVIFYLIYKKEDGTFERTAVNVPAHLHIHIKDLLDSKLDGMEGIPAYFWSKKKGIID